MKAVIASVVTALAVAAGAGAYVSAITPGQFSALKAQVSALQGRVSSLQGRVSSLEISSAATSTTATATSTTAACLRSQWNQLIYWPQQFFVWNTIYYSGVAPADLNDGILSIRNVSTTFVRCP